MLLFLMLEDFVVFVDHLVYLIFAFRILSGSPLFHVQPSFRLYILDLPVHNLLIFPKLCVPNAFIIV